MPRKKQSKKRKRIPFGRHRTKLQVDEKIPGYVLRWFNHKDGRIEAALEAGYVFVEKHEISRDAFGEGELHEGNADVNSKVSKVVTRGHPETRAYLMKIEEEYYREDQEEKEKVNRMVDDALRASTPGGNVVENQYTPKGHTHQVNPIERIR